MGSNTDKFSGKAKQVVGKATDDKELQAKGKTQETSGKVKGHMQQAGKKLTNKVDEVTKKLDS